MEKALERVIIAGAILFALAAAFVITMVVGLADNLTGKAVAGIVLGSIGGVLVAVWMIVGDRFRDR